MMYWPVAKEIRFENISNFSSDSHVVQLEAEPSINFGRGQHFFEIILDLDQWFRRKCRLKVFFI